MRRFHGSQFSFRVQSRKGTRMQRTVPAMERSTVPRHSLGRREPKVPMGLTWRRGDPSQVVRRFSGRSPGKWAGTGAKCRRLGNRPGIDGWTSCPSGHTDIASTVVFAFNEANKFAAGVAPTAAAPTHRSRDAALDQCIPVVLAGVLGFARRNGG